MAELTQKERLQPSLLDRLTDDEPNNRVESRDKRVLSMQKLRQSVLRDVSWLLNADSFESVADLTDYPEVAQSVINFGIQNLAGTSVVGADLTNIERKLKQAITVFEPRILPNSLSVKVLSADVMNQQAISFDIEANLWAQPLPIHLYLRTEIDVLTGDVNLRDMGG
ncbi:MAG: type VI secretion system baseplate subunit TssE [Gammaproteobacteria bacterium]|uniref:type VI secretion system baseplate subunit TssE n=1 Tax=Methylotuvimicrobium sp. TaxID=2822413 RepID=UPI001DD11C80|nr:type VI secretion system baseplate subunit TssE [Gammaproteobacteria bacterium]